MLGAIENASKGFWKTIANDRGVQQSAASVLVSVVVAGTRYLVFKQ